MSNPKESGDNRAETNSVSRFESGSKSGPKPRGNGASDQTTLDAIKDFLRQNSPGNEKMRFCGVCSEPMEYLDAYFWVDGTDIASIVPLPFCPLCQPDVLTSLRRQRNLGRLDIPKAS